MSCGTPEVQRGVQALSEACHNTATWLSHVPQAQNH